VTRLLAWFGIKDWKRGIALVILWAYAYQLCAWPPLWWLAALANAYGVVMPLPPLLPWELLAAGTAQLASIGSIQVWRERGTPQPTEGQPQ